MSIMRRGRHHAAALGVVLLLTLSACGDEEPPTSADPENVYLPTESPSVSVSMIDPPADYSTIEGVGFQISAPSEFQRQTTTSSNQEPMLILEKPSEVVALPQRVVVIRDVAPDQPADEQSFALETAKAAGGPDGEVSRVQLEAPEGQTAFLITWKEVRPAGATGTVQVTYWQLMHQVTPSLIINVVALAPTEEFESSEVSQILRTFVPEAS